MYGLPMKRGTELSAGQQQEALRTFVNRFTGNHRPTYVTPNQPVQFADDADWLANTDFAVTKRGYLDRRVNSCRSYPTWPNNPELRKAGMSV